MRALFAVAVTACVASACSLGALDGFSGGGVETVPAVEAGIDAGADALVSTGPDASDGGGSRRFCETLSRPASACVDFDDGKLPFGFGPQQQGGTVSFDAEGKDGTKGAKLSVAATGGSDGAVCFSATLPGPRSAIEIEADLRVEVVGDDNIETLNLRTSFDRELGISMTGPSLIIEEDYPGGGGTELARETTTTATSKPTWQKLRFTVTAVGNVARSELFVDGVSVGKHDAFLSTMTDTTEVQIGDCGLGAARRWIIHYDNIVIYETR